MRIAIVGPAHPYKGGGVAHTTELAHRLRAAGHDVVIESWRAQYPSFLYPGQQTVDTPDGAPFPGVRRDLDWRRPDGWVRAGRRLASADLVILAVLSPVQVPPYLGILYGLRRRTPVVALCHNVLPHERKPYDEPLMRALLRRVDGVLAHSERQAALARKLGPVPVTVAEMAPHLPAGGRDRGEAASTGGADRAVANRLLFFGLVRPYKGLDLLIRALPEGVSLRVAGEFWGGLEETKALVAELGLTDRVELRPGYVADDEVPGLFEDVDALVLPYRSGTASQQVWLGHEHGTPVIASRVGTLGHHVTDGVDGLLVEPGSVEDLRAALSAFYRPGEPERLRAGVKAVDPDPYWAAYLDALVRETTRTGTVRRDPAESTRSGERAMGEGGRAAQLEYSEFQSAMLDEEKRRRKAAKIVAVLGHFLGRKDRVLEGLTVADIGCSAGFIADELAAAGASRTFGVDIDVPGLRKAAARFGERVEFVCADGTALPFPDGSVDVLVFNHIYEHVVDPDAIMAEMRRVLTDDGVLYLGLGNRLGVMEPHYKLPFLSYLPPALADRYVRLFGRADSYYERYRTRRGLRRMVRGLRVWDYTFPVLATPAEFAGSELFPGVVGRVAEGVLSRLPRGVLRALLPVVPTYLWVATKSARRPAGASLPQPPEQVRPL
ncbi:hypothetical protein GCM10017600_18370 [Streptosporangium carneum]|uniref:Glycosyl transferase n=2 Tax=Streptosporangium carneum TaxID=47481 RepID=A0A9W6HY21_9ACTN|nr:hypothetical protein GCM10017600_18370 [Streptosporangium carneum]